MPVVQDEARFLGHTCTTNRGGVYRSWPVLDLWELAKDLHTFELPPEQLPEFDFYIDSEPRFFWWSRARGTKEQFTMRDLADHIRRVNDADLSFPILLNPEGGVMDGLHRMMKAHILGVCVRVQQFEEWPPEGAKPQ